VTDGRSRYCQPPSESHHIDQSWINAQCLRLQASIAFAQGLGWHLDASGQPGEVDADACVHRVHALYKRAMYFAAGIQAQKDSGKQFVPDWNRLASTDSAQKEIEGLMVRLAGPFLGCVSLHDHKGLWHLC
jgi:hypothetical protein